MGSVVVGEEEFGCWGWLIRQKLFASQEDFVWLGGIVVVVFGGGWCIGEEVKYVCTWFVMLGLAWLDCWENRMQAWVSWCGVVAVVGV